LSSQGAAQLGFFVLLVVPLVLAALFGFSLVFYWLSVGVAFSAAKRGQSVEFKRVFLLAPVVPTLLVLAFALLVQLPPLVALLFCGILAMVSFIQAALTLALCPSARRPKNEDSSG